jgi:NAD(P)-dependent dehydrogenase (short-subunit alcohol dehydrogenase family)
VTGGASGIGADIVRAFTDNGSKVAFVDIDEQAGAKWADATGATFIACDITDVDALLAAIETARKRLGPIGVLVNNAANDERHRLDEVSVEYWDQSFEINLRPHFFAAQAVRAQMRELGGGAIVNFSSIAWRRGADAMVAYATAKSAVIGLTNALARAFGADNIRVNAIEPGAVMTERQRRLWYKTPESVQAIVSRQAIQRVLLGDEVARLALFLAADDSAMLTKQSIILDAGLF